MNKDVKEEFTDPFYIEPESDIINDFINPYLEIMPRNHEADICNPNNDAYLQAMDNHADQLNPNNDEYAGS